MFIAVVECIPDRIRELAEFSKKRGPIKGVKLIGNYGTPVGKGVTIIEAESEDAVFAYFSPTLPFFKNIEIYPALPMEKVMEFAVLMKH